MSSQTRASYRRRGRLHADTRTTYRDPCDLVVAGKTLAKPASRLHHASQTIYQPRTHLVIHEDEARRVGPHPDPSDNS